MHFDHFFCLIVFSHATSLKCFSDLSEASRIANKVSRDIRPEFSSVLESHSCFALRYMKKVKCIGSEFYCDGNSQGEIEVFPALKTFILRRLENLKEWTAMTAAIMFP
ncbi:hypothetical protein ES332_D02G010900v1 [Gossypium tomentosum]|uniref:Uncharacterized protein n=1 Tax=Gossypium tomentosum TaxID=34277 RepID=A0A5D2LQQ0_GOSTO|nr:hypothetical protein ES332_D02G010900v1 [Gossypium tomentosum]